MIKIFGMPLFHPDMWELLFKFGIDTTVLFILIGSSLKVDLVWALADFFNGLMAVPNLLALLALSGVVAGIARNKKD